MSVARRMRTHPRGDDARLAQQSMTCIDAPQRSLEQQALNEALLHVTRLQNHARQIELEMEQARVEAKCWGRHSKEVRALVQDSELDREALLN